MGASFLSCCEIFIQPHSLVRCKNVVWSSWYHQEQGHSLTGQTRNFSINDDKKKIWRGSLTENTQINHDCNGNPRILTRPYQRRWEGFSHLRATCVRPSLWHLHAVLSGSESDAPDWRNRANVNKAKEKNTFSFTYFLFSVAVSTHLEAWETFRPMYGETCLVLNRHVSSCVSLVEKKKCLEAWSYQW